MLSAEKQFEIIKKGTVSIIPENELKEKLAEKRPLRIKWGADPTAPDIHLGHVVVMRKLRQFQDLGHKVVLIIGDFTALIGDPSGESKIRPILSEDEVKENARTYVEQAGKVLNMDKDKLEVLYNSQWLKSITLPRLIELATKITVARLLERNDFSARYKRGEQIGLHEFLYAVLQGYDSIAVNADVEIGGSDQTFNLLTGRHLQASFNQPPQVAITMPLLVGLDGKEKMSKSLGNYIGVTEDAFSIFSKIMSIPDALMPDYFRLLTDLKDSEIEELLNDKQTHPMSAKKRLAYEVSASFNGKTSAEEAKARWEKLFSKREIPEDIPLLEMKQGVINTYTIVFSTGLFNSNSEARRLIKQGAVEIDGKKMEDPWGKIEVKDGMILKVGKKGKYFRIKTR